MTPLKTLSITPTTGLAATGVWIALVALTLAMGSLSMAGVRGPGFVILLLATAFAKGHLIAEHFMALRRVRMRWRAIVFGYLLVVVAGIGIAYRLSLV